MLIVVLAVIFAAYYGIILILSEVSKRIQENRRAENQRKRFRRLMDQY